MLRHLQYFSTHPYLAPSIIGSSVKAELTISEGDVGEVVRMKEAFMGPYAALGDQFFWGGWLPLVGLVASGLALVDGMLAPLMFVVLFVPYQLWIRWRGFLEGYRRGKEGFRYLYRLNLSEKAKTARRCSLIVLPLVLFVWARFMHMNQYEFRLPVIAYYGLGFAASLAGFFLLRAGIPRTLIFYLVVAFFCLLLI